MVDLTLSMWMLWRRVTARRRTSTTVTKGRGAYRGRIRSLLKSTGSSRSLWMISLLFGAERRCASHWHYRFVTSLHHASRQLGTWSPIVLNPGSGPTPGSEYGPIILCSHLRAPGVKRLHYSLTSGYVPWLGIGVCYESVRYGQRPVNHDLPQTRPGSRPWRHPDTGARNRGSTCTSL